jgi:hypothetical protein
VCDGGACSCESSGVACYFDVQCCNGTCLDGGVCN